jgi:Putative endonuclease segE, GIY-YIG domain
MQWTYDGKIIEEIPEGYIGFVYLITNLVNNRKYIGKKLAQFKKSKPPLKGKKLRRKFTVESDWRDYWSSSDSLKADVEALGKDNFTREILYWCTSKAELSYLEAREQFNRHVLETDEYYNGIINVRVGGSNILRERLLEHEQILQRKNAK